MGVHAAFSLPSPPAFVAVLGASNAPWRVYVATQHASLHVIDNGKLLAVQVQLDALPAGLVRVCRLLLLCMDIHTTLIFYMQVNDGNAVVGLTSGRLVGYTAAGRRLYSTPATAPVVAMAPVDIPNPQHVLLYAVALADGAVDHIS